MTKLEEKLKELGYYKDIFNYYTKRDICIFIYENKIYESKCCVIIQSKCIRSRNDIQALKDSIEDYDEQLRIMWKDLEELKLCQ